MTLSWPSFLAAATSPLMPPKADIEVAAAAFTALLVLLLAVLLELEEPQPTVSSRLPATAAPTAIACLAPESSLPNRRILARQVQIMASQDKPEVASPWRPDICWRSG